MLTTAAGQKMGKTVGGAVWLNEEMLSRDRYWQFWRDTHDEDVGRFLRLFTDLPTDEIDRLERLQGDELQTAKTLLADAATSLCRGSAATAPDPTLPPAGAAQPVERGLA